MSIQPTIFALHQPASSTVAVAGSFNHWSASAHPLVRDANGWWKAALALPPGRYEYRYVADGIWIDDPGAEERVPNPFGGFNCVREVKPD